MDKGTPMTAEQLGPNAYVQAFPLLGKNAIVRTTHEEIADQIDTCRREMAIFGRDKLHCIYRHIYKVAIDYQIQVVDDSEEKKKNWQNFCDDVVLLCVLRLVLFGKLIPVQLGEIPMEPGWYQIVQDDTPVIDTPVL